MKFYGNTATAFVHTDLEFLYRVLYQYAQRKLHRLSFKKLEKKKRTPRDCAKKKKLNHKKVDKINTLINGQLMFVAGKEKFFHTFAFAT